MNSVAPVEVTLPDGSTRPLRFTLGARKRIVDLFGVGFQEALNKYDTGAVPGVLFALMHDENGEPPKIGNPPADMSPKYLEELLPAEAGMEMLAAIISAAGQGRIEKKEILERMQKEMLRRSNLLQTNSTGPDSTPTAPKSSTSPEKSSGGGTSNVKSSRVSKSTSAAARPNGKNGSLPLAP